MILPRVQAPGSVLKLCGPSTPITTREMNKFLIALHRSISVPFPPFASLVLRRVVRLAEFQANFLRICLGVS
jgi:hypothetical protein